jgi:glycosyltransferase involved in cell wall biosynthesis
MIGHAGDQDRVVVSGRQPMRICIVVPRYLPHLGGIENHVAALAARLQDRGHHVTVATQQAADGSQPSRETDSHGVTIRRFPAVGRLRGEGLSPALCRWVHGGADQAHVIHLHNYHSISTLATFIATPASVPILFTPHYIGPADGRVEHLIHRVFAAIMRPALRSTVRIISTTRSEAEAFQQQVGFRGSCTVIPNGVDVAAIRAAEPLRTTGRRLVVTAGRFEEYKQQHLLIEALPFLSPEYRLALVGSGPMEQSLRRRAADLGVTDRVSFPGRMSAVELYGWFRAAEVVVSLSRRECFGLTLAEGLAAGAAVVASDIGPHRDVMELAGVPTPNLVPVRPHPEEVGVAVAAARRPSREGGCRLPDWDDVASATLACYREVARA